MNQNTCIKISEKDESYPKQVLNNVANRVARSIVGF